MTAPNPAIVLISEHHVDTLRDEFGRYARDYDVYPCTSATKAFESTRDVVVARAAQVAMVVTESVLPDADVHMAFHKLREKVPTARRVVAAHWERFIADGPAMRAAMAKGKLRRLPADAARRARRGVPQRDHRPALGLGLDRPRPRGRVGQDHLAHARPADHGDPRLPRPDGDAEPGLGARHRGGPPRHRACTTASRSTRSSTR